MTKINSDNLEKALDKKEPQAPAMSKEMEIGFHQGALNTLVNERNELIKMAQITEQIMAGHIKRLEDLGVKIRTGKTEKK